MNGGDIPDELTPKRQRFGPAHLRSVLIIGLIVVSLANGWLYYRTGHLFAGVYAVGGPLVAVYWAWRRPTVFSRGLLQEVLDR